MQYVTYTFLALLFSLRAESAPHAEKSMQGFYCASETAAPQPLFLSTTQNKEIFKRVKASDNSNFSLEINNGLARGAVLHEPDGSHTVVGKISQKEQEGFFALVELKSYKSEQIVKNLQEDGCDGLASLVDFVYDEPNFIDDTTNSFFKILMDILPSSDPETYNPENHGTIGIRG